MNKQEENILRSKEIAESFRTARSFSRNPSDIAYNAAIKMANWKDEYYKKLLDLLVESGADTNIITNYIKDCIEL